MLTSKSYGEDVSSINEWVENIYWGARLEIKDK